MNLVYKGLDAPDWQNLFRPSKFLDKICLCQIFNLSSVGALMHSKIFVNHKFQSRGNKHHRLLAVRRKGYMTFQESSLTASIEYVTSAYCCLCASFFSSLNSYNSSRRSGYFYYANGGFSWLTFSFKSWRTRQIFVYFAKKSVTSCLRQVRPVNSRSPKSKLTKLQRRRRPASEQEKFLLGVKSDGFVNLHALIWRKLSIKKIWSLFSVGILKSEAR